MQGPGSHGGGQRQRGEAFTVAVRRDAALRAHPDLGAAEHEHVVEVAASGREAVARLQSEPSFDLVITDRAMPEMGGDELAAMIKVLAPSMPVLMLTGFADLMGGVDDRPAGVDLVIGKPTTLARLRVAIATLTGEPASTYDLNAQ